MGEEDIEGLTVGRGRAVERIAEPSSERSSAFPRLFETGELLASTRSPDRSIGQSSRPTMLLESGRPYARGLSD